MEKYYTLNEVAMMTGLNTRTLRNYLKMDVLKGEKIDGIWKFSECEFSDFISNPYVKPSLQAKSKAIVFDFLNEKEKQLNEICTILDLHVDLTESDEISEFFCTERNKRPEEKITFSFERNGAYTRLILRGYEDTVMEILNAYYRL